MYKILNLWKYEIKKKSIISPIAEQMASHFDLRSFAAVESVQSPKHVFVPIRIGSSEIKLSISHLTRASTAARRAIELWIDEKSCDVILGQKVVSARLTCSVLENVLVVEQFECLSRDVNLPNGKLVFFSVVLKTSELSKFNIHSPRNTGRLHLIGDDDIVRPNVVLPLSTAHDAADDATRVYANAHIDVDAAHFANLTYDFNHLQTKIYTVFCMKFIFDRQTANAVIAIAQEFYSQNIMILSSKYQMFDENRD